MFSENEVRKLYERITKTLIEKRLTITTMESATAGQIASLLTDTEGASAILKGAFVTYSNEAKVQQGVAREVIDTYSVYSKETALAMAAACKKSYGADIGIGITGTMGNTDPANLESSVPGHLYFAIDAGGEARAYEIDLPAFESRLGYKLAAAGAVGEKLWESI